MEAFASALPEPPSPAKSRRNRLAENCEDMLCTVAKYFPLVFVYGLTTWAIWVEATVSIYYTRSWWKGTLGAVFGISIYVLMNSSYTVAVFTDPGTPLKTSTNGRSRHQYSHLPTSEDPEFTAVTVNSLGDLRYCKKCQSRKPDRTHHCSTCGRCVLKMDHHCPWLATCVGMYNYKAFVLFLVYTCLFCYVCLVVSVLWVWDEMLKNVQEMEHFIPVNVIVLAVVSGMMGLVLTGFAGWHVSLAARGLTTIECLEKTRYLAPVRKTLDRQRREWNQNQPRSQPTGTSADGLGRTLQGYGQQFIDMHANAIPGVTRAEEGEERPSPTIEGPSHGLANRSYNYNPSEHHDAYRSPAQQSLFRTYGELDRAREHDRYEEYLAECDSEKLPHAFDLGWRLNLLHLFGSNPLLWPFPVITTTGDGWRWEASVKWQEAKLKIDQQRMQRWQEANQQQQQFMQQHQSQQHAALQRQVQPAPTQHHSWHAPEPHSEGRWAGRFNSVGNKAGTAVQAGSGTHDRPSTGVSMKTLRPMSPRPRPGERETDTDGRPGRYSTSSNEDTERHTLVRSHDSKRTPPNLGNNGKGSREEWADWD